MKSLIVAVLMFVAIAAHSEPWLQHASLSPSAIQGELFVGAMRTNQGISNLTLLPIFYRNAPADAPWYEPSFSPLAVGGGSAAGNVNGVVGAVVDAGPQLTMGIEQGVGLFSTSAKAAVTGFFNCSSSATACASISAGAMLNLSLASDGHVSTTSHELFAHPLGVFLGPQVKFGGAPLASVN